MLIYSFFRVENPTELRLRSMIISNVRKRGWAAKRALGGRIINAL